MKVYIITDRDGSILPIGYRNWHEAENEAAKVTEKDHADWIRRGAPGNPPSEFEPVQVEIV